MPETLFTVWVNLFERGFAADGDWVLVHGGTSGIGTMAIALGKLFGLNVIVTCGTDEKCARALELGADAAINYATQDFVEEVAAADRRRRASRSCSTWSAAIMCRATSPASPRTAATSRSRCSAAPRPRSPIVDIMRRRLTLTGSTLRPRSVEFKTMVADEIAQDRLALCRGRAAEAGDRQRLPARRGGRRPCADGSGRACRQDRAGDRRQ